MLETLFPGLGATITWILVDLYGWVIFVWALLWIGYQTLIERQIIKYLATIKWVFLEVRVDELNERSALASEQMFTAMHAMLQIFSLGERWSGRVPLHMSAEIVSIGGRVSYIFKVPERYRNLLESAVFAQYPKAEIREIQDYLGNLPRSFDPTSSEFEMWGTQLIKGGDNALPIRTYRFIDQTFQHSEQKTTIEPLANVIEAMSNLQPYELEVVQVVIQPVTDDWKKAAVDLVNKMKGLPAKPKAPSAFEKVFLEGPGKLIDALIAAVTGAEPAPKKEEKPAQAAITTMSDFEKGMVGSVVAGLSKLSFKTKIRVLYLAPKDKFSKGMRVPELLGAFRAFNNPTLNSLRPSIDITTDSSFKLFQKLEQPWLDHKILARKNKFLRAIKDRGIWEGSGNPIFSTEELATIFHFPQSPNARISQVEKVQTVKSAPPIDLPVG
jgi:hypothetical protein